MLILGGELGHSSASSERYMVPHWRRLKQMHLNTVVARPGRRLRSAAMVVSLAIKSCAI
jgi:hypothetical protein